MSRPIESIKLFLALTILSVIVYIVYFPGLSGPFLFDDFPNLEPMGYYGGVEDSESAARFVFGNNSGPTGRPVSMASFLMDDNTWPSIPFLFKHTNLLLHIVCGLTAFLVLYRLMSQGCLRVSRKQSGWVALVVVGVWFIHPVNLSTVLYVVQRMAILSALFSLASIYFYLVFRSSYISQGRSFAGCIALLAAFLFFTLALFSKENAFLVIPFLLFLEIFCFQTSLVPKVAVFLKKNLLLISFLAFLGLALSSAWWASGYERRDFTLTERIVFQLPIIGDYALKIVFPTVSSFNLFAGDYEHISSKDFSIIELGKTLITMALLAAWIYSIRARVYLPALALSWFFIFHLIESTVLPIEPYFEHRNYLPSLGLILFVVFGVRLAFQKLSFSKGIKRSLFGLVIGYLGVSTLILSLTWSRPDTLFLKWEMDEPNSARAKVVYASLLEQQTFSENALEHVNRALSLRPEAVGLHLLKLRLICQYSLNGSVEETMGGLVSASQFAMGPVPALTKALALDNDNDGQICRDMGHPVAVERLFSAVESAQEVKWNPTRAARYFALKADYYSRLGNLNMSAQSLDSAIAYTPTVDLFLKKAVMLASAGLFDEAQDELEFARQADSQRYKFYPSRLPEIESLEAGFQQALDAKDQLKQSRKSQSMEDFN